MRTALLIALSPLCLTGMLFTGCVTDDATSDTTSDASSSGDSEAQSDASDASNSDSTSPAAGCEQTGEARAMVLAIDGAGDVDEIRVISQQGGAFVDRGPGFKPAGMVNPRRVTMREDGKEAIVAWGGIGSDYGFSVVQFAADGTSASVSQTVKLGSDRTTLSVAYAGMDLAVIGVSGPKDELITLERTAGKFSEVARTNAPGTFPRHLERRGKTADLLLGRVEFGKDSESSHYVLRSDASKAFLATGSIGAVAPPAIDLDPNPAGTLIYVPTTNPSDPITSTDLSTTGVLHVLRVGTGGITKESTSPLPRLGTVGALDPNGKFYVTPGNIYELDTKVVPPVPIVRSYTLVTTPLDADGKPGTSLPESQPFPALLFDDIQVTSSSHLITALSLYEGTVAAGDENPLRIWAQNGPGQWQTCATLKLAGSTHFAILKP